MYNSKVLLGNWFEDCVLQKEKTKTFKRKRENGQLLVQQLRELFCNLMREIPLSKHVEFIQFGNCVQLKAPDMPAFPPLQAGDNYGVILAGTVPDDEVEKAKKLSNGHGITCSPILQATARNAFLIKSADSRDKDGQNLLFGQEFVLQLVGTDEPLYVRAETPTNMSAARGPRQHNPVVISNKRDCYCNWKVLHWNSNKRFDTEGAPFSPFFRVIICHVMTGKCLTVEAVDWYLSIFGLECGVSVHTYLNSHKHETAECMWMFVTENI